LGLQTEGLPYLIEVIVQFIAVVHDAGHTTVKP